MTEADTVLGRYALGERLAAGSLGTVVAATDLRTGRAVAVKFFDGARDNFGAWVDEMRLALRLEHPHIVPCLDVGHDTEFGLSVMVFPRALGGSLRRALASGCVFAGPELHGLLLAMARALAHAHARGVVHRDVKPENILALTRTGEPPWALTDFGAGRFLARGAALRSLAGSLPYMAPEVAFRVGAAAGAGLGAVTARLLDPDPGRRFPDCDALVSALTAMPCEFAVGRTADGASLLLAGDEVWAGAGERRLYRVPRARRFVHEADEVHAIVACDRRLVGLDERVTTMFAVEGELTAFVASRRRGAAWLRCGERLIVSDLAGGQVGARVPLPDAWGRPGPAARLTGVTLSAEMALLGQLGTDTLLLVERVGRALRVRVLLAPAPVYALQRGADTALVHCGDERGGGLCALVGGELKVIDHGPLPVDCQAISSQPGPPRRVSLLVEDLEGDDG